MPPAALPSFHWGEGEDTKVMELEFHQLETKYEALRIREPGRSARLVGSLSEHGQRHPVLVVRGSDGGGGADGGIERYVLIDGYARVAALRELGRDTVEATVLELSEAEALVLAFRLERNRARSVIEEAWLLRELVSAHAIAQRELAGLLGRSASWVSRRLALVEVLPEVAEKAVRVGRIAPQAAMRCLVPLARANTAQCTRLVENLGKHRISVRQMAQLYAGWRAGTAEQRERIVAAPLLYLDLEDREQRRESDPVADPGADREQRLVRDLGALASLCRRARRGLGEREKDLPWPAVLRYAWQEAQASFAALVETVVEQRHA